MYLWRCYQFLRVLILSESRSNYPKMLDLTQRIATGLVELVNGFVADYDDMIEYPHSGYGVCCNSGSYFANSDDCDSGDCGDYDHHYCMHC